MTRQLPNGLIARFSALRKIRDEGVATVVPASGDTGGFADLVPGGLECRCRFGWVGWLGFAKGEDVPLGARLAELVEVPTGMLDQSGIEVRVHRDRPALAGFCLGVPHS